LIKVASIGGLLRLSGTAFLAADCPVAAGKLSPKDTAVLTHALMPLAGYEGEVGTEGV
jgi:hypothetical protein